MFSALVMFVVIRGIRSPELHNYTYFSMHDRTCIVILIKLNELASDSKRTISASGGAFKSITVRLYDSSQCPPSDSQGRIHFGSCNIMLNQDYSTGDKIDKYIPHGGKFYLYLQDSSPFFNKVVIGNIYVEYLP